MSDKNGTRQTIEDLTKRYQSLDRKKTTAEANLENARKELEALRKEALEKYGTDSIEALEKKLKQIREENEKKRAAYQASLDEIENNLEAVEKKYQTGPETKTE